MSARRCLIVLTCLSALLNCAFAGPLRCSRPVLADEDFKNAVGNPAAKFSLLPDPGPRCRYEHPSGSFILLKEIANGNYAADEFNAKREADAASAQMEYDPDAGGDSLKYLRVPHLGADAYKVSSRRHAFYDVLNSQKSQAIEVEVQASGLSMNAGTVAKRIAELSIARAESGSAKAMTAADQARARCDGLLSEENLERALGLRPDQISLTVETGGICRYFAQKTPDVQTILQVAPKQVATVGEAALMLKPLKRGTLPGTGLKVGADSGVLGSGLLWFLNSDRHWIVTVSYHEVSSRDNDPAALAPAAQASIRNEVAKIINENLPRKAPPPVRRRKR